MELKMKKLIALIFLVLAPLMAQADYRQGVWKHHYVKTYDLTTRLSYKESFTPPTYGLHNGGRLAYKIHLDVWGNISGREIEYKFFVISNNTVFNEFSGFLEYDNDNHKYAVIIDKMHEYIWLSANYDYQHILEVIIDGKVSRYELNL